MPLVATRGAASAQGFGEFAQSAAPNYIEDVFSTFLYSGNASTRSINNGIDLAGKGGIVLFKARNSATNWNLYSTTSASPWDWLSTLSTDPIQTGGSNRLQSFNSNGFTLGADYPNWSGYDFASWTFRKQPKFFDVVTWTGDGTSGRSLPHSLGSVPGCVIIKRTSNTSDWLVWHRSLSGTYPSSVNYLRLNLTSAQDTASQPFTQAPSSTDLTLSASVSANGNGSTYVAYIFAHDAGGFGLTGTDNVISCGSYTGTSDFEGPVVNLGFEPQWLLIKSAGSARNWVVLDNMRGLTADGSNEGYLLPNTSDQEDSGQLVKVNATGFQAFGSSMTGSNGVQYIYIAIRRGPMKTPTSGTSVFDDLSRFGNATVGSATVVGFPADMVLNKRSSDPATWVQMDRLRGNPLVLFPNATDAEFNLVDAGLPSTNGFTGPNQNSYYWPAGGSNYNGLSNYASYFFRRAPGFFDEVCYTGNNVYQQAQTHNLGVAPELIIVKRRNATANWAVGCNFTNTEFQYLNLNSGADGGNTNAYTTGGFFGGRPTATTFILAQNSITNASGGTYVAYLFATLAGVSKVGTYTGTGALQTINCGFTSGARFVLIKRLGDNVDPGTGDWFVYDSTRGITSGNDPYLLINSATAEVTGTNYVDTTSVGFQVTAAAPAGLNANGGTYIFLAIA